MSFNPKEEADKLIEKMKLDWGCDECHNSWAAECALVAIEHFLEAGLNVGTRKNWLEVRKEVKRRINEAEES